MQSPTLHSEKNTKSNIQKMHPRSENMRRRERSSGVSDETASERVALMVQRGSDSEEHTSSDDDYCDNGDVPIGYIVRRPRWSDDRPPYAAQQRAKGIAMAHWTQLSQRVIEIWDFKKGPTSPRFLWCLRMAGLLGVICLIILLVFFIIYLSIDSFMMGIVDDVLERDFPVYLARIKHGAQNEEGYAHSDSIIRRSLIGDMSQNNDGISTKSRNSNNIRVSIGVGEMKTGTTFFGNALHYRPPSVSSSYEFIAPTWYRNSETKFWSNCIYYENNSLRRIFEFFARDRPLTKNADRNIDDENSDDTSSSKSSSSSPSSSVMTMKSHLRGVRCNWDSYITREWDGFDDKRNEKDFQSDEKTLLLSEKTPNYMSQPHSSKLLATYAQIMDVKMYVILRHPVNRLWSHYFFSCRFQPHSKCNSKTLIPLIEKEMDSFRNKQDKSAGFMTLIDDESISNEEFALVKGATNNDRKQSEEKNQGSSQEINNDGVMNDHQSSNQDNNHGSNVDGSELHRLYIESFYRDFVNRMIFGSQDPIIFKSCYFPHLQMFYDYLISNYLGNDHFYDDDDQDSSNVEDESNVVMNGKLMKRKKTVSDRKISSKLKIIQQEWISASPNEIVWKFKCWALRKETEDDQESLDQRNSDDECSNEELEQRRLFVDLSQAESLNDGVHAHPGLPSELKKKWLSPYRMCDQRLYTFLESHPELLLKVKGMKFHKWED